MKLPASASVARWLAAGLIFLGVNTAVLYLLVHGLGLKVLLATLISAELCTLLRYVLNEYWVFGAPDLNWRRLWRYHVANGGAFAVWWIATNLLTGAGFHYIVASILAVGFSTGFSFVSNFYWVWRQKHPSSHDFPFDAVSQRKVVAGIVLLRDDGAVLLQLRDNIPSIQDPGIWVVPGGHIEAGETPREGACREFLEETCYRCTNPRPLTHFPSGSAGYTGDFDLVFFWDRYDGIQEIECREGQALEFIARSEAGAIPCRNYLTKVWELALSKSSE